MRTKNLFALCLTALLIAGSAGVAFAQGGDGGGQGDPNQDPLAVYRMSGINSEQEEQIRKLAHDFEDAQRVRAKSLIALMTQMRVLSLQPDPPEEQVLLTQTEVNKVTGDMAIERQKLLLKVRKVLTPEQRKKLVSIMSQPTAGTGAGAGTANSERPAKNRASAEQGESDEN
ncbi:periplasmic heavy metal sensor [Candidatus Obscuribacterales bacterium]|nr:periplasmic heavy metal sensor [Candidatus Obscuribacterales bacterium]MBX3149021.1 periplasmic heavy metal sensor [Candidatus Obscuribacterales bacterium]